MFSDQDISRQGETKEVNFLSGHIRKLETPVPQICRLAKFRIPLRLEEVNTTGLEREYQRKTA